MKTRMPFWTRQRAINGVAREGKEHAWLPKKQWLFLKKNSNTSYNSVNVAYIVQAKQFLRMAANSCCVVSCDLVRIHLSSQWKQNRFGSKPCVGLRFLIKTCGEFLFSAIPNSVIVSRRNRNSVRVKTEKTVFSGKKGV